MYESFYGLREKPFNLTPDPKFLYLSKKHKEAFAHLLYGIRNRSGFVEITGEVGTGKTTICRTLLSRLVLKWRSPLFSTHIFPRRNF
jgi:general secretion pathway protein A